jgi:cell division protein FtsB
VLLSTEIGPDLTKYVVELVLVGVVGVAAWLVRNAFEDLKASMVAVNAKLDLLVPANAKLEQRVEHLEQQLKELRDDMRDMSEGVAR